jgi:ATP-dependent Lon protease
MVRDYLKKERFDAERSETFNVPGIATGLAVTSVGGDILYIEASRMPGKGRLSLTGQLGSVMKESAEIALSYVRTKADQLDIDPAAFEHSDVHVHVPAGALPKDGPIGRRGHGHDAGQPFQRETRAQRCRHNRRNNAPRPGASGRRHVKMKALAAHRAGLKTVILPRRNRSDMEDLPEEIRSELTFVTVDTIEEAIAEAFADPPDGNKSGSGASPTEIDDGDACDTDLMPLAC